MERGKMGSKKIEDRTKRNITFSKRHGGLLKKAYELSILSASDVVVITRHPSKNKLCYFSHPKRAEDILIRFLNMPDDVRKVNGQEFRERFVIPNKDSLIVKLQNCKTQEDAAAEEIMSIEQGNSRAITSGDDSRSIQHTKVMNPRDFLQQFQGFYQTTTPMTPEQLFDDYEQKLKVMLSHFEQRKEQLREEQNRSEGLAAEVMKLSNALRRDVQLM